MAKSVAYRTWRGSGQMSLIEALTPDASDRAGLAECAQDNATKANEAIGRILAVMVEKGVVDLKEAVSISGNNFKEISLDD